MLSHFKTRGKRIVGIRQHTEYKIVQVPFHSLNLSQHFSYEYWFLCFVDIVYWSWYYNIYLDFCSLQDVWWLLTVMLMSLLITRKSSWKQLLLNQLVLVYAAVRKLSNCILRLFSYCFIFQSKKFIIPPKIRVVSDLDKVGIFLGSIVKKTLIFENSS